MPSSAAATLDAIDRVLATSEPPGERQCPQCGMPASGWEFGGYRAYAPGNRDHDVVVIYCSSTCSLHAMRAYEATLPECTLCGYPAEYATPDGLVPLCVYCYDRDYIACPICDQEVARRSMTCGACRLCQDDLLTCDGCGERIYANSEREHDGGNYCSHCIWTCSRCDSYMFADESFTTTDDDRICDDCASSHYIMCEDCERYVSGNESHYDDDRDETLCWHCFDQRQQTRDDSSPIHNYSYKPYPMFDGRDIYPGNGLYMGIELEVETRRGESVGDAAQTVLDGLASAGHAGIAYLKHDGSLSRGFEIVTHPCSFEFWQTKFPAQVIEAGKGLYRSYGFDSTGFHIHMSKAAFGNLHLYKFCRFHYDNQRLIEDVAQRSSPEWAAFRQEDREFLMAYAKQKGGNYSRYVPVNMQNADTIELRYFKGNILAKAIRKNVQFAHAVYMFSKDNPLIAMTTDKFCEFVSAHASDYRELRWYMNAKGYTC